MIVGSLLLAACGGGTSVVSPDKTAQQVSQADPATVSARTSGGVSPLASTQHPAFRTLTQASFGPTPDSLAHFQTRGRAQWLAEQFALPWTPLAHTVEQRWRARLVVEPTAKAERRDLLAAFWREALTAEAQLRWRVAFALSQIFVVSLDTQGAANDALGFAHYYDTLAAHAFGNYRQLIEAVALHPVMGRYLSHRGNMPADDASGRVPDENFARELMQLFTIGLVQLHADGSPRLGTGGQPLPTYDGDDVAGLASVFTGYSWHCLDGLTRSCFNRSSPPDAGATRRAMAAYPEFHSQGPKIFLGTTIPAQAVADPAASVAHALDTLAAHDNVGPFMARQLIQRLVTSNPSPAYVAAVAAMFANNGMGVRGDLRAVVRAILTHDEALQGAGEGKLREPVLRLGAFARAFGAHSPSGNFNVPYNDPVDSALGQAALRAPSVFNYYRPGYVPPGGALATAGLVGPELQIADETQVASHLQFMRRAIERSGFGSKDAATGGRDIALDFGPALARADDAAALVDLVHARLLGSGEHVALREATMGAVDALPVPALNRSASNQGAIDRARRDRVRIALLLTAASPEFAVQR